jgi:pyrroline-5-carboxylate reductase
MHTEGITFVGGGNMARSLIGGLVGQSVAPEQIRVLDPDPDAAARIQSLWGVTVTKDPAAALADTDTVVVAVKPQVVQTAIPAIREHLPDGRPLVISVAAGTQTSTLTGLIRRPLPVIRAMPNTPALLGCGATALFAAPGVNANEKERAEHILRSAGLVVWVDDERQMDAVTAVSGSGPAYFFYLMEHLLAGAVAEGLPEETARLLVMETALGAAKMALESEDDIATLRRRVTSPGGTTEAAIDSLRKDGFGAAVGRAVAAAADRSRALAADLAPTEESRKP